MYFSVLHFSLPHLPDCLALTEWVVNQPRELFHSGLLIALRARQFGLATGLFVMTESTNLVIALH